MTDNYSQCLRDALSSFNIKPTGSAGWDSELLCALQAKRHQEANAIRSLSSVIVEVLQYAKNHKSNMPDLSNPAVYNAHAKLIVWIADNIVLAPQRRRFIIDKNNADILRFLLLYFNDCPLAEDVFPDRGYKLHKNIMLQGSVGVGKTMMMQIFSEYLRRTNNPHAFQNVSVTQMVNHYSIYNNIDLYTYNEGNTRGFKVQPYNLCLNDIGVENRPFYGIDTLTVVTDFLHARNELWANQAIGDRKFAHLTTNLNNEALDKLFKQKDSFGRVVDRFKTYNVIPLTGNSRR